MQETRILSGRYSLRFLHLALITLFITGCTGNFWNPTTVAVQTIQQPLPYPQAEVTFVAHLPRPLVSGQNLYLEFLDEVTGLALNATRSPMQTGDGQNFTAKLPFVIGSVLKYRYARDNDPVGVEYATNGQQVRYRLFFVDGPGTVNDTISAWRSEPAVANLGRIQGQVAMKDSNAPVVNALVTAGGISTLTASDGSFVLEGLPPGTHNMVVYSLDGLFHPFQQGAVLAPESTTPALVLVAPANTVEVTFIVTLPKDALQNVPVRLIGNLYSLGNTYADLNGGENVLSSRSPIMSVLPDGRYTLRLLLPSGLDLRYKYTLGDGFWNAELTAGGAIRLRQLIVPEKNVAIQDTVETWSTNGFGPVTFVVTPPAGTPTTDSLSIQFNPFGWTEPVPMWPTGDGRWMYVLYSPLNLFNSAAYRYCRNEQCGTADAVESQGQSAAGKNFSPTSAPQHLDDVISAWAWMDPPAEPVVVSSDTVNKRDSSFMAGVELSAAYHPSWQPYTLWGFQNIHNVGSNMVILAPTWHVTHQSPPVMAPVAGQDPLWSDMVQMSGLAQRNGLGFILHPTLQYSGDPAAWWQEAPRDAGYWDTWFSQYRTFLMYHADMAAQSGAQAMIIGDDTIIPALPDGLLADGTSSGAPTDAAERWQKMLGDVRGRYTGKLLWLVSYSGKLPPLPDFLGSLDGLYVTLSAPFSSNDAAGIDELESSIGGLLDGDILSLQQQSSLPVYLGFRHPSAAGGYDGCIESNGSCLGTSAFLSQAAEPSGAILSLKEQADAYSAILELVNQRSWVNGFFAVGYYPQVEVHDMSTSVRGKPAMDALWYWYPRMLGQITP